MRDMNSPRSTTPAATQSPISPVGTFGDHMRISACCNQGGRKYMEDRINIHCEFLENGQVDYLYVGIYDGHGGADASNFANQHLLQNIIKQPGFNSLVDSEVLEAIRAGFIETHNAMRKVVDTWPRTASGFTSTSGTTSSVAFIRRGKLYIGHVGDSGIVLGSQQPTGEFVGSSLTIEHKPDSPEEKKRIEEIGGEVMSKSGVMRVVWVRPLRGHQGPVRRSTPKEKIPFLAVARALGDLWSYNSDMDAFVVSPEPDVSVLQLDSSHRCLIFGSDGLWNVLRPQHAVDIVNSHEWKEDELGWLGNQNEGYETNHARWLTRHALMRWGNLRADNISVVTIILGNRGIVDSSYAKRVERDGLSIENILTTEPTSIIKVAPNRVIAVPTKPVELVYYGVSEAPPIERQPFFTGNHHVGSAANDYHRIPGYTNHEKGPVFGSLLSAGPTPSFASMGRSALHAPTPYRQYSQMSNVFSAVGSSQLVGGKENGTATSGASPTTVSVASRITTTTTRVSAVDNVEEESEVEDETMETTATTVKVELEIDTEVKSGGNVVGDDQENGQETNESGFTKCNSTPCKPHGMVSCCSCTLTRAPLTQWSATGEVTTHRVEEYASVTPRKDEAEEPAAPLSSRRHTINDGSPAIPSLMDAYKCRRLARQRRSCPNPATPHNYNTRQSCRTTRAGTKLSPQKSLSTKLISATPQLDGHHRQNRHLASSSRRRSAVPQSAPPPPATSIRSHRRRASVIRQQLDPESTPRRRTPSSSSSAKAIKVRKGSNKKDGMRLRSAKTPTVSSAGNIFALAAASLKKWETRELASAEWSLSQDRVELEETTEDTNVETLGAQFLESLNLETPNVTSIKRNREIGEGGRFQRHVHKGSLSVDGLFLHTRSSGSKPKNHKAAMMSRKSPQEDRRRASSMLVTLKRKLYFDDHALIEQRSANASGTTLSKRMKNFNLLLKRST